MVHSLQLATRCAVTMTVAGGTPSGLLHGRRNTLQPSLLPHRPPNSACPWTSLALSSKPQTPQKLTYRDVLRAPPPRKKRRICHHPPSPPFQSPTPSPLATSFAKRLQRGGWRWQSLAHCLDLLLPTADTLCNTAPTTNSIPFAQSDPITHWLPTPCLITTSQASLDNDTDCETGSDISLIDTFTYEDQDSNDDSPPTTSVDPQPAALLIFHTITPPKVSPTIMDISRINTPNAHRLWC